MKRTGHDGRPGSDLFVPPRRLISDLHERTVDARRDFEGNKEKKKPQRAHSTKVGFREIANDYSEQDHKSHQGIGAGIFELPINFQTHHQEHEGEEKNRQITSVKIHLKIAIMSGRSHPIWKARQDTFVRPDAAKAQSKDWIRFQGQQFAPDVGSTGEGHVTTHGADYRLANAEHLIEQIKHNYSGE